MGPLGATGFENSDRQLTYKMDLGPTKLKIKSFVLFTAAIPVEDKDFQNKSDKFCKSLSH